MSDFSTFSVLLTRGELGLAPLELNDHIDYIVADQLMGAQQSWNRQTAKSPFVDGEFTVHRSAAQRQERVTVQVLGDSQTVLRANLQALIDTIEQFRFQMTITMNEAADTYQCETADYQIDYDRTRWIARQILVTLQVPVYPGLVTS